MGRTDISQIRTELWKRTLFADFANAAAEAVSQILPPEITKALVQAPKDDALWKYDEALAEVEVVFKLPKQTHTVRLGIDAGRMTFTCTCADFVKKQACGHCNRAFVPFAVFGSHVGIYSASSAITSILAYHNRSSYNRPPFTLPFARVATVMAGKPSAAAGDLPPLHWWEEYLHTTPQQRRSFMHSVLLFHIPFELSYSYGSSAKEHILNVLGGLMPPAALVRLPDLFSEARGHERALVVSLPPEYHQFLAGDHFREIISQAQRTEMLNTLMQSLDPLVKPTKATSLSRIDLEWDVVRKRDQPLPRLVVRVLLTGKTLDRSPRLARMLNALAGELSGGNRELEPEQCDLKDWFRDLLTYGSYAGRDKEADYIPLGRPGEMLAECLGRGVLTWAGTTREPIVIHNPPAQLTCQSHDGAIGWAVRIPDGDGTTRTLELAKADLCVATHQEISHNGYSWPEPRESLYLREGDTLRRVDTGGMSVRGVEALFGLGPMPLTLLRSHPVGATLGQWLAKVDPHAPGVARKVRPSITLTIRSTPRQFRLSTEAQLPDGTTFSLGADGRWRPSAVIRSIAPTASTEHVEYIGEKVEHVDDESKEDALTVIPDPTALAPLVDWLDEAFGTKRTENVGPDGLALVVNASEDVRLRLLKNWPTRPTGVSYLGNEPFRKFINLQHPPRIGVKVENSGINWLQVSVELEAEVASLSLAEVRAALASTEGRLVPLSGGRIYQRDELEKWKATVESLHRLGLSEKGGEQRLHALQAAGSTLTDLTSENGKPPVELMDLGAKLRTLLKKFTGIPSAPIPEDTLQWLRPYQRAGADQLVWSCETFGGGMLCDDMGLGKTLQLIAALAALRASKPADDLDAPALVVCPQSVTSNWRNEIRRFAPGLRVKVLQSGGDRAAEIRKTDEYDVLVTNYSLARFDEKALGAIDWLMVCVDEAQAIKNPRASISEVVKRLDARYTVALSGTPLENRLLDLWSIADFAVPGLLGSQSTFMSQFTGDASETILRARLRPVLIRRRKEEVAPELPPRIEETLFCEMLPEQKKLYAAEVKNARAMMSNTEGKLAGPARIQMLALLTKLRQICCDPQLVGSDAPAGKMEELIPVIEELLAEGKKILLFSQFVRMLDIIKKQFVTRKIPHYMLTGQTKKRGELVKAFETDKEPSVFLISLKAGGTGLNLVSASHVVIFDPWWNPAVEAQAIDRAHRIGQDKSVLAVRMVAKGTVEERIQELQQRKLALVGGVFDEDTFNASLSVDEIGFLLEEVQD